MVGDFNARTAELKDFSVFTKKNFQNGDEYLLEHYITCLSDSNLPLNRKNMDKGNKILLKITNKSLQGTKRVYHERTSRK